MKVLLSLSFLPKENEALILCIIRLHRSFRYTLFYTRLCLDLGIFVNLYSIINLSDHS